MKRIISIIISFCLLLSLSACGKSDSVLAAEKAISEIGTVSLESADAILHAQEICDQLSESERAKVSNLQKLDDAKEQLNTQYEVFYQNTYDELVSMMLDTLVIAENICNDTVNIWHNSIWKVESEESNPYTKDSDGAFFEDFNDALYAYEISTRYSDYVSQIRENDAYIKEMNEIIKNPTDKFKGNMMDAYVNYYTEYLAFIQLALNNNESYNSFTEKFDKIEETSIDAYRKAAFYMSVE